MQAIPQTSPRFGQSGHLTTCRNCGQDKICNAAGLCGNCQTAADKPVVITVCFTEYTDKGAYRPAAHVASTALSLYGITRTQVLAVNAVAWHQNSNHYPVERLYYTLEVPAAVADALLAEQAGR